MSTVKIIGETLPNIPWQEKPADAAGPVWRHSGNPVIDRNPAKGIARIFNSAVVPYEGRFVGVFRAETINGRPHLHLGWSEDGYGWKIDEERIPFTDEDGKPFQPRYAYDPRLVKVGDTYYIIWCTDFYGASIGVAKTRDFQSFVRLENPFLPFNRNGELDPLHETQEAFFNKLGYIDIQNLADRISAKVIFVTGLADSICPPYTQFAAYNKIVSANGVGRLS
ncbi:glycoside hydrolase family 130 protein [Paenibacillus sp. FSL R5-0527]|uniref:glycoside hydrolase family 130 protein n=1 Tax=Paenibacillus sp. FSL R5-0527 TaxID=2975321 RepID=UPI0026CC924D